MKTDAWLEAAVADARRRGLPGLEPLLTALARSTEALRRADLHDPVSDELATHAGPPKRADD